MPPTLQRLSAYLKSQEFAWEILVVSNGSTDDTESVVSAFALNHPAVRLLTVDRRGKGLAARAGALASWGDLIFLCDADLSMPPEYLQSFLNMPADVDVVVGSREAHGSRRFNEPWHRHVMGRVFNRFVQLLAVPGVEDTQCGFKAFRRYPGIELFQLQTLQGLGFDVELLYLARKFGYHIRELGIPWYFRRRYARATLRRYGKYGPRRAARALAGLPRTV